MKTQVYYLLLNSGNSDGIHLVDSLEKAQEIKNQKWTHYIGYEMNLTPEVYQFLNHMIKEEWRDRFYPKYIAEEFCVPFLKEVSL